MLEEDGAEERGQRLQYGFLLVCVLAYCQYTLSHMLTKDAAGQWSSRGMVLFAVWEKTF